MFNLGTTIPPHPKAFRKASPFPLQEPRQTRRMDMGLVKTYHKGYVHIYEETAGANLEICKGLLKMAHQSRQGNVQRIEVIFEMVMEKDRRVDNGQHTESHETDFAVYMVDNRQVYKTFGAVCCSDNVCDTYTCDVCF